MRSRGALSKPSRCISPAYGRLRAESAYLPGCRAKPIVHAREGVDKLPDSVGVSLRGPVRDRVRARKAFRMGAAALTTMRPTMQFPVPDLQPIITAAECVVVGVLLMAAFALGYIVGGIVQRG